jgi:hypothetical protein
MGGAAIFQLGVKRLPAFIHCHTQYYPILLQACISISSVQVVESFSKVKKEVPLFSTLALVEVEWSASNPGRSIPGTH